MRKLQNSEKRHHISKTQKKVAKGCMSCGASSTDAARASRSSRRQRRVARRGFRHAGMRIDMQGSLELRSLFPFVSRPRAYIIHVISTLWIKQ